MQDQPAPRSPSRHEENDAESQRQRWMNLAMSGLILAGFVAFFGLVAALIYIDLEDKDINLWYNAFWYVLAGVAVLSVGLACLRFRLMSSRQVKNAAESRRSGWMNIAMSGLILAGLVALFGLITALVYVELSDIADEDINLGYMAFWCALAGMVSLSAVLACLRWRLFLRSTAAVEARSEDSTLKMR